MKQLLRHTILFLLLFLTAGKSEAGNTKPAGQLQQQEELTRKPYGIPVTADLTHCDQLPVPTLSKHASPVNQASKRQYPGNDLLFLQAAAGSINNRTFSSYAQEHPNPHTQYFILLFPHHDFW